MPSPDLPRQGSDRDPVTRIQNGLCVKCGSHEGVGACALCPPCCRADPSNVCKERAALG